MAAGRSLGTLTLDLIAKIGGLTSGMTQAERAVDKSTRAMEKRLASMRKNAQVVGQAIGLAFAAAAGVIARGVKSAIDNADHLNDLNQRLGVSAEALSGWAYVAKQTGTDIDGLALGLKKLTVNLADAVDKGSEIGKIFAALDIEPIDAATGKLRDLESVLPQIADKFKALNDPILESKLAIKLFGKQGADLLEFLNLGSAGIDQLRAKLREMGGELSGSTLSSADQFNDQLNDLHTAMDSIFNALAKELLPDLIKLTQYFKENYTEGDNLRQTAVSIADGLRDVATAASVTVTAIKGLTSEGIALYNVLAGLSKLNLPAWLGAKLAGQDLGAGENFAAAGREFAASNQLGHQARQQLGFEAGPVARHQAPGSVISRGGSRQTQAEIELAKHLEKSTLDLLANEKATHGKSKADHSAADAARRHAKEEEELRKQIEETTQAHADFEAHAQDLADELAGPAQQALTEYTRELIELTGQAQKGEVSTDELAAAQANLTAEYLKKDQAIKDSLDTGKKVLEDLQFQIDLTNMATQAERDRAIFQKENATATLAQVDEFVAKNKELSENQEAISAADQFRDHWVDAFSSILDGSKSVKEAFSDLASAILADIARMLAKKWVEQLFGQFGSQMGGNSGSGNWGSVATAALSAFGGGSAKGNVFNAGEIQPFAAGGIVSRPTIFPMRRGFGLMGEAGEEGILPLKRGKDGRLGVIGGGGSTVNQTFVVQGSPDRQTREQLARKVGREARRALARG